jgi:hypothetical protein
LHEISLFSSSFFLISCVVPVVAGTRLLLRGEEEGGDGDVEATGGPSHQANGNRRPSFLFFVKASTKVDV